MKATKLLFITALLAVVVFISVSQLTTAQKKGGFTVDASCGVNATQEMTIQYKAVPYNATALQYKADAFLGKCSSFYRGVVSSTGDVDTNVEDDIIAQQTARGEKMTVPKTTNGGKTSGGFNIKQ